MSHAFDRFRRAPQKQAQVHEVDVEASMELAAGDPRERLRHLARGVLKEVRSAQMHKIPMLPGVASRAMELAQRKDADIRALEAIIAPDPMITARVLAIANSPLYGVGSQVRSLRAAMIRLGVELMCDVLYQTVAEAHMFKGPNEETLRWHRLHAVACAYMCRGVSSLLAEPIESPFLCGLMHDLGETILSQIIADPSAWQLTSDELPSVIHYIHPHVGDAIAERWRLPQVIREAARRHHRYCGYARGTGYSKVGNVVHLADRLVCSAGIVDPQGYGAEPLPHPDDELDLAFKDLELDHADAVALWDQAQDIRTQLGV